MVYCGIDIGTSNVKAIVLADDGGVLAVGAFSNSSLPAGGEQAKSYKGGDCWYRQFCRVMDYFHGQGVFEGQKVVCCVACQGGSFILIDDEMNTLGQISLWTSGSGQSQADKYLKHYSGEDFYRLTGWAPAGWMPIFKLKEMEFAEGEMVAFVSDYIYARLTGELVTDITSAQMTGLVDFEKGCWDESLVSWAGLYEEDLPEIEKEISVLFEDVSTEWGQIDIVTSLHDQYAAMNAVDLKAGKDVMLATGTAWVVNFRSEKPGYDSSCNVHPGRDIVTGGYGNISTMGAIGAGFDEVLKQVGLDYDKLEGLEGQLKEMAMPTGAVNFDLENISVQGEAALQAVRDYMVWSSAVVRHNLDSLGLLGSLEEILMTGGAGQSGVWAGIIADVCGVDVKVVIADELTAYGAAITAARACGCDNVSKLSDIAETVIYKSERADEYKLWYEKFQKELFE